MSDFFISLRRKIEIKPTRQFDREFWSRFNGEFGHEKKFFSWQRSFAGIALVAILTVVSYSKINSYLNKERERVFTAGLMDNKEMVSDLSLFLTFDKLPTSDKEWAILLPDGETEQ